MEGRGGEEEKMRRRKRRRLKGGRRGNGEKGWVGEVDGGGVDGRE